MSVKQSERRCCWLVRAQLRAQSGPMTHPTIELFEQRAALLDLQGSEAGLDEAIVDLAAWVDLASQHLTEDDLTVLGGIGGVLYREGLRRRQA